MSGGKVKVMGTVMGALLIQLISNTFIANNLPFTWAQVLTAAIILVVPNQRFAVTKEDGTFSLSGLDSGNYTITAWHAQAREKTEDVAQRVRVVGRDDHGARVGCARGAL